MKLSMLILFTASCLACFCQKDIPFTLIELYTSQGCSSCPPADRLLTKILAEAEEVGENIYPLSFHVDYWNYLGWKDPYSDPKFSARQRKYAEVLKTGVYTPQMIFNGGADAVGSKEREVKKQLKSAKKKPKTELKISIECDEKNHSFFLNYSVDLPPKGTVLNIAIVERGVEDFVKRGENHGRILKHDNVVRSFETYELKPNSDTDKTTDTVFQKIPKEVDLKNSSVVVFIQDPTSLEVLAATKADFF